MKIPNWLKITLWLVLIASFSWLLSQRYDSIIKGTSNATDIVIFLIWIALIAVVIFQEVDFFGVKIKKEIDNLKSEFKEQIINLRSDIQTINMKAEINPQINVGIPSSDSELKDLEKRITPIIKKTLKEQGVDRQVPSLKNLDVPDNIQYLFSVRYWIEKELNNLANVTWVWMPEEKYQTPAPIMLAKSLFQKEVINQPLFHAIQEVIAICNRAIHDKEPSATSIQFVQNMAPEIIATLRVLAQKNYIKKQSE